MQKIPFLPFGPRKIMHRMDDICLIIYAFHSTFSISNVNFTSKISVPPESVFRNMGQQISGPDSSNGESIRHEFEGWGLESPLRRDIFCLKNFDTFTRTSVCVSKMNAVARTQLTFQM